MIVWATLSSYSPRTGAQCVTVSLSADKWLDEAARLATMLRAETSLSVGGYERTGEFGFLDRVGEWTFQVDRAGRNLVAAYVKRTDREMLAKIRAERACRHDFSDGGVCSKCDAAKAVA